MSCAHGAVGSEVRGGARPRENSHRTCAARASANTQAPKQSAKSRLHDIRVRELSNSLKTNFTGGKRLQVGEEQSYLFILSLLSHLSVSTAG